MLVSRVNYRFPGPIEVIDYESLIVHVESCVTKRSVFKYLNKKTFLLVGKLHILDYWKCAQCLSALSLPETVVGTL